MLMGIHMMIMILVYHHHDWGFLDGWQGWFDRLGDMWEGGKGSDVLE